ncbi:MAG: site-2 protease family protein [Bacteroidota bacterium]
MIDITTQETLPTNGLPKFPAPVQKENAGLSRSALSLILYLLAGYWLLGNLQSLLLITFVLLLHEAGHFIAMRRVGYRDLGVFFLPLLGAYVSGTKRVITQKESAVVLLAGPLPGILLGCLLYVLLKFEHLSYIGPFGVNLMTGVYFLIVLNGINLLPVYPLDGGQLLNRVFLDEDGLISKLFVIASAVFMSYLAVHYGIYPLLLIPAGLIIRIWRSSSGKRIEKLLEENGINTEVGYESLPDEDYWRIRQILIEENSSVRSWAADHPSVYAPAEEQIQQAVEAQLHRTLIHDLSVSAKVLILLIWSSGLILPGWLWLR